MKLKNIIREATAALKRNWWEVSLRSYASRHRCALAPRDSCAG